MRSGRECARMDCWPSVVWLARWPHGRNCTPSAMSRCWCPSGSCSARKTRTRNLVDEIAARVWYALVANDGELLARYKPNRRCSLDHLHACAGQQRDRAIHPHRSPPPQARIGGAPREAAASRPGWRPAGQRSGGVLRHAHSARASLLQRSICSASRPTCWGQRTPRRTSGNSATASAASCSASWANDGGPFLFREYLSADAICP